MYTIILRKVYYHSTESTQRSMTIVYFQMKDRIFSANNRINVLFANDLIPHKLNVSPMIVYFQSRSFTFSHDRILEQDLSMIIWNFISVGSIKSKLQPSGEFRRIRKKKPEPTWDTFLSKIISDRRNFKIKFPSWDISSIVKISTKFASFTSSRIITTQ